MNLFTDEFRSPIFAGETARAVWELVNQRSYRAFSRRGRGKTFALANRPAHRGALAAAQSQNHAGLGGKFSRSAARAGHVVEHHQSPEGIVRAAARPGRMAGGKSKGKFLNNETPVRSPQSPVPGQKFGHQPDFSCESAISRLWTPQYRGRLAPSPTGLLHLGHARTFWVAQERARANGGTLVLRNEDIDSTRFRLEFVPQMIEDLRWFGFEWQEGPDCGGAFGPYSQSERRPFYAAALEKLRAGGFVYPCTCSRKDIRDAASAPNAGDDEGPIYPGTCRARVKVASESDKICAVICHCQMSNVSLRIGVFVFLTAKPFPSPMAILANKSSWPEKILAISSCGGMTTCRRINWRVWWTTRRWASPKSCAGRICC